MSPKIRWRATIKSRLVARPEIIAVIGVAAKDAHLVRIAVIRSAPNSAIRTNGSFCESGLLNFVTLQCPVRAVCYTLQKSLSAHSRRRRGQRSWRRSVQVVDGCCQPKAAIYSQLADWAAYAGGGRDRSFAADARPVLGSPKSGHLKD